MILELMNYLKADNVYCGRFLEVNRNGTGADKDRIIPFSELVKITGVQKGSYSVITPVNEIRIKSIQPINVSLNLVS